MAPFTIMTWNVENLYRAGTPFGPPTQDEYEAKLGRLADAIVRLDPDVLALQEVGSLEALDDLVALLNGRYPHQKFSAHPDIRGIRVGFVSKLPIEEHEDIRTFPAEGLPTVPGTDPTGAPTTITTMSRGALRIRLRPRADLAAHCIVAHLKSKLLTYPGRGGQPRFAPRDENERARVAGVALLRRSAEAVALRVYTNNLLMAHPKEGVILLGDLNDGLDAATTQILYGPGGSEIGTAGFDRPDAGDAARLFNLAPLIAEGRRYSRVYRGNKELIDHILVSQALLPGHPRQLPVVDSHIDIEGPLPSILDDPQARRGKPGSDHAPVTARFEL